MDACSVLALAPMVQTCATRCDMVGKNHPKFGVIQSSDVFKYLGSHSPEVCAGENFGPTIEDVLTNENRIFK